MCRQLNAIPIPVGFQDLLKRKKLKVEISKSERAMLSHLLAVIQKIDPDIVIGHNILGFGLDVLLHRMKALKMETVWSKLGRLRRSK